MKNKLTTAIVMFMVVFLTLGLIPLNYSQAITQNQINSAVKIVCPDNDGNWYSGSGTMIDSKGIILTNKHVVTDQNGDIIETCAIGFVESLDQAPNFYTNNEVNVAEVKYYTTTDDMDTAILYLENPTNKIYSYTNIWSSNSSTLQSGDKIEVIGFPGTCDTNIANTSGDFIDFGGSTDSTQNYIKATVPIDHGNSGGAAYNVGGEFIGTPTYVIQGTTNTNYILSINGIRDWLNSFLGSNYQQQITSGESSIQSKISGVQEDMSPPDLSKIGIQFYDCSKYFPEKDSAGNVQSYPTIDGVKGDASTMLTPEQCTLIPPNSEWTYDVDPQTLYFKLSMTGEVKSDIYTMADWWSTESLERPLEIQTVTKGSKDNITLKNGFFKPSPNINAGEGTYYYSLQVADQSNNISDTKIWQYNYSLTGSTGENKINAFFSKQQAGKILLQVEANGEAYYVYPDNNKGYYLGRPADAFRIMRELGLGATHKFITSYTTYPSHVSGKILIDVDDFGKAYYVYPKDKKAYYLGRPADAFRVMRELGLGITNSDLNKIPKAGL